MKLKKNQVKLLILSVFLFSLISITAINVSATWYDNSYAYCVDEIPSTADVRLNEPTYINFTNGTSFATFYVLYNGNNWNYSVYFNNLSEYIVVNQSCNAASGGGVVNFQLIDNSSESAKGYKLFQFVDTGYGKVTGNTLTPTWVDLEGSAAQHIYNTSVPNALFAGGTVNASAGGLDYQSITNVTATVPEGQGTLISAFLDNGYVQAGVNTRIFLRSGTTNLLSVGFRTATSAVNYTYQEATTYFTSAVVRTNGTHLVKYITNSSGTQMAIDNKVVDVLTTATNFTTVMWSIYSDAGGSNIVSFPYHFLVNSSSPPINNYFNNTNFTQSQVYNKGAGPSDTIYPIFSNYLDNPYNSVNKFNVTVENTNGTVYLNINGTKFYASNVSNKYNVTIPKLFSGTYVYNWTAYGNGTDHNSNTSINNNFKVNVSRILLQLIYPTTNINVTLGQFFNVTVNITCICA